MSEVVPRPPVASLSVSLREKVADVYLRVRASRSLMAVLLIAVTLCWFLTRLQAYTDLVQNRRQQAMSGFGALLSVATAPPRYFPWRGDGHAAGRYDNNKDIFRDLRPFAGETFLPSAIIYTEKGILFPLRIASRYFRAPASATTLLAVQLAVDLFALYGMLWLLWSWGGPIAGSLGGLYYATSEVAASAATFPFYYYWPIPFGLVLCLIAAAAARRGRAARLSTAMAFGVTLAYWLLFRSTAVLLPLAIGGALLLSGVTFRRCVLVVAVVFCVELAPQFLLKSAAPAGERVTLGRGNMWHALYLGIGTRPNPYGIEFLDSHAWTMVRERYGIAFQAPGYETALRREYLRIARANPELLVRNAVLNFRDAIKGWSFPMGRRDVGRHLWIFAALGVAVVLARRSEKTFPVVLAAAIWVVQCATLALILRPQEGYLWETAGIRVLAGFAGIGLAFEWLIEKLTRLGGGFAAGRERA